MIFSVLFLLEVSAADQKLRRLSTEPTNLVGLGKPTMLGQTYDLSVMDLWDFKGGMVSQQPVLDFNDFPAECAITDASCTVNSLTDIKKFATMSEASSWFQSSSVMSFGGGWMEMSASVKAAWGKTGKSSWFEESYGSLGISNNIMRCHTLDQYCFTPNGGKIKLNQGFVNTLKSSYSRSQEDMYGCDSKKLEYWDDMVIRTHGTHVALQVRNGAMLRYEAKQTYSGSDMSQCMFDSICLGMEMAGFKQINAKFSFCTNSTSCSTASSRDQSYDYSCRKIGGSEHITSEMLCSENADPETIAQFLDVDDERLNKDSTVIGMDFMEIDELIMAYAGDYEIDYPIIKTVQKAREYHFCKAQPDDVWRWDTESCGSSNPGSCKCIRKCANGGKLDEHSCTCKCKGNAMHGFKGETCEEEYGTCQPGAGTGNPTAARQCAVTNKCASANHGYNCKQTDVCCITSFAGACCPYGSSCKCGTGSCTCVPPADDFLSTVNINLIGLGPIGGGSSPSSPPTEPVVPSGGGSPSSPPTYPVIPSGGGSPTSPPTEPVVPSGGGSPTSPPTYPVFPSGGGSPTSPPTEPVVPSGGGSPTSPPTYPVIPSGGGSPTTPPTEPVVPSGGGSPSSPPTVPITPSGSGYAQKNDVSCRKHKIMVEKKGRMRPYRTRNLEKAQMKCDELGEDCIGVMDSGCNGKKYTLCKKSDKPLKSKPGYCIYMKEN